MIVCSRSAGVVHHIKCYTYKPSICLCCQAVIALVQLYKVLTFRLDPERHPVPGELELRSGITLAPKVSLVFYLKDGCEHRNSPINRPPTHYLPIIRSPTNSTLCGASLNRPNNVVMRLICVATVCSRVQRISLPSTLSPVLSNDCRRPAWCTPSTCVAVVYRRRDACCAGRCLGHGAPSLTCSAEFTGPTHDLMGASVTVAESNCASDRA